MPSLRHTVRRTFNCVPPSSHTFRNDARMPPATGRRNPPYATCRPEWQEHDEAACDRMSVANALTRPALACLGASTARSLPFLGSRADHECLIKNWEIRSGSTRFRARKMMSQPPPPAACGLLPNAAETVPAPRSSALAPPPARQSVVVDVSERLRPSTAIIPEAIVSGKPEVLDNRQSPIPPALAPTLPLLARVSRSLKEACAPRGRAVPPPPTGSLCAYKEFE